MLYWVDPCYNFNIIISNTQQIKSQKNHNQYTPTDQKILWNTGKDHF